MVRWADFDVSSLFRLFAYVSAFASATATITIIMFFSVGQPWGTFNDFSYGIMTLVMLPLLSTIHSKHQSSTPRLSNPTFTLGVVSLLGYSLIPLSETLQEVSVIRYGSLEPFPGLGPFALGVVFFFLVEVWLLMVGLTLKRGGEKNAIRMSLIAVTAVGYPVWAGWLARRI